jgi:hypothetical protein
VIGGVDYSGTNRTDQFAPGTAFIKLLFLFNYFGTGTGNTTWVSAVSLTEVTAENIYQTVVDARADDTINAAAWDATTAGVLDAVRDALIAHGLLAAS